MLNILSPAAITPALVTAGVRAGRDQARGEDAHTDVDRNDSLQRDSIGRRIADVLRALREDHDRAALRRALRQLPP